MKRLIRQAAIVLLALATALGNVAVCAGWQATPEARMACCAKGEACPMHAREAGRSDSARSLTQAAADACCASAEDDDASPSAAFSLAGADAPAIVTTSMPDARSTRLLAAWRVESPPPFRAIPRHLLLTVLLV